jgi:hypothetical protein
MKKVALGAAMFLGASLTVMAPDVTLEQRHQIESATQKWADAFNNKDYRQQVSYGPALADPLSDPRGSPSVVARCRLRTETKSSGCPSMSDAFPQRDIDLVVPT